MGNSLRLRAQTLQESFQNRRCHSLILHAHLNQLREWHALLYRLVPFNLHILVHLQPLKQLRINGLETLECLEREVWLIVGLGAEVVDVTRGRVDEVNRARDVEDEPIRGRGVFGGLKEEKRFPGAFGATYRVLRKVGYFRNEILVRERL